MTQSDQHAPDRTDAVASWTEPEGLNPRGTVIVIPGRGERPGVYERFGRRLAGDAYRVHAVANPVDDPAVTEEQIKGLADGPKPLVLAGSDTGALFAVALAASGRLPAVGALILAGLPADVPVDETAAQTATDESGWEAELEARTACPTHRGKLAGDVLRRGALYEPVPDGWAGQADLKAVSLPILGLHGAADPVSPLPRARQLYITAPRAELVTIADGRHDAFNDITHRTAAAIVILFLERLRNGSHLRPIAVQEYL
jgi:alpha-beta hydrolase superfamily lysophospholipase